MLKSLMYCAALSVAFIPLQAEYSCINTFWADADYLYWQVEDSPKVIPLVIEQPIVDGPFDVVLGGKKIKNDWHSGARFTLGYWMNECLGAEISYFFLGKNSKKSHIASDADGFPRLRVPYIDVNTDLPDSSALSTPGVFRGTASLKVSNSMQGLELNLVKNITECFQLLAGFRYWNFEDSLTFFVNSPLVVEPTVYTYQDKFRTLNNFYGAQVGAYYMQTYCSFFFDVRGKLALGALCQKSKINGRFQTNEFTGSVETFEGGFFALPTNSGHHKKTRFSVIPELNLNAGYFITDNFNIHFGYSVLYVSEVIRASKQISNRLNPTQSANIEFTPTPVLVGEASPTGKLRSTGLWAQGFNVGIEFKY